jgi:hypothetical protein
MGLVHKAIAVLLWAAVSSSMVGQTFPPAEAMHKPPSGCHEHGQKAPSPAPVTYKCCATGHNAAVLQQSSELGGLWLPVSRVPDLASLVPTGFTLGSNPQHSSGNRPPGSTSLRI